MLETISQWLHTPMVVQGIGFLAAAIGVTGYLFRNDAHLKYMIALATCVLAFHLYLLGAVVGAFSAALVAVRFFTAARTQHVAVGIGFVVLHLAVGLWVYNGGADFLPIVATVNGTIAVFFLSGVAMRLSLLFTTFLWLTYNALHGSYGGALLESFYMLSNMMMLIRMTWRMK